MVLMCVCVFMFMKTRNKKQKLKINILPYGVGISEIIERFKGYRDIEIEIEGEEEGKVASGLIADVFGLDMWW